MTDTSTTESLMEFPMMFPVKIMGLSDPTFPEVIGNAIKELAPDFDPTTITVGYSKTGKYMALTATVNAQSKAHIDSIYMMLTAHPMVKISM